MEGLNIGNVTSFFKKKEEKTAINLLIIGIGPHSRRIYLPIIRKLEKDYGVYIKLGIDLVSQKDSTNEFLMNKGYSFEMLYVDWFNPKNGLPMRLENHLNQFVSENNIHGVIIATEPLAHKVYAMWALKRGLHILMDKPITTRKNVVRDISEARGIYKDYLELLVEYLKLQRKKKTIFSINVQRRFEAGHQKVFDLIGEVRDRFDAPVTSIQSSHADGVWILPEEIETQIYHPYNVGYGKCSHSGYHIFDIVYDYYRSGLIESKKPDSFELYSSFVQPSGLLTQFSEKDFEKYFGPEYKKLEKNSHKDLIKKYKNYGELDAFSVLRLLKNNINICNISINLLHNSFSRRTWMIPSEDLYKGNGRVKSQSHFIQQGPFQSIQVHNYQSESEQGKSSKKDYNLGGNNHFDIHVFRNSKMFGGKENPLTVYKIRDLNKNSMDDKRLYHESVKSLVVEEFLKFISGEIDRKDLTSNIDDHEMPVKIMSAVYQSHINYTMGKSPLVKFQINL
jgi:hypothetical protein